MHVCVFKIKTLPESIVYSAARDVYIYLFAAARDFYFFKPPPQAYPSSFLRKKKK
jgi:hypothetical protein